MIFSSLIIFQISERDISFFLFFLFICFVFEFDGWKQRHCTLLFVDERYSLVYFTPQGCEECVFNEMAVRDCNGGVDISFYFEV